MDSNYIIERLKSTPYKYTTVEVLRTRLQNIEDTYTKELIINNLKKEVMLSRNMDIQHQLEELLFRLPVAS